MTSKREQILAAVKTNLANTTGVADRIYRSRVEPIARGETPAIVIEPITDEPTVSSSTYLKIDWTLRIRVVVVIRGTTPESIGDGTIESLHAKMLTDTTIGGLAKDVRPSTQTFEFIEGDQPSGVITCEYEIDYRTGYNSLTT
jgi:hypothetical protein|tara:strand:- start:997 stop:1425 length:429 start_codon:yes stop_codon:yes gene_type:complete